MIILASQFKLICLNKVDKVIRVDIDQDLSGWRPNAGQLDKYGREIEDRIYNQKDIDRTLVLEKPAQDSGLATQTKPTVAAV